MHGRTHRVRFTSKALSMVKAIHTLQLWNDLPPERREALRLRTFTFYASDSLRDVMTNLYADPANTYIRHDAMVYISRDKLSGKDVEPILRHAREEDRGYVK